MFQTWVVERVGCSCWVSRAGCSHLGAKGDLHCVWFQGQFFFLGSLHAAWGCGRGRAFKDDTWNRKTGWDVQKSLPEEIPPGLFSTPHSVCVRLCSHSHFLPTFCTRIHCAGWLLYKWPAPSKLFFLEKLEWAAALALYLHNNWARVTCMTLYREVCFFLLLKKQQGGQGLWAVNLIWDSLIKAS